PVTLAATAATARACRGEPAPRRSRVAPATTTAAGARPYPVETGVDIVWNVPLDLHSAGYRGIPTAAPRAVHAVLHSARPGGTCSAPTPAPLARRAMNVSTFPIAITEE